MRLFSRNVNLSVLLLPVIAAESTVQIPAGKRQALNKVLHSFLNKTDFEDITRHGCWCAKASRAPALGRGGSYVSDPLDQICKDWFSTRHCIEYENGDCANGADDSYSVSISDTGDKSCDDNFSGCARSACLIDVSYLEKVEQEIGALTGSWLQEEAFCPHAEAAIDRPDRSCGGSAPNFVEARTVVTPEALVNVAKAVQASGAAFSVNLAWLGPTPASNNVRDLLGAIIRGRELAKQYISVPVGRFRRRRAAPAKGRDASTSIEFAEPQQASTAMDMRIDLACSEIISTIRNQGGCGTCWAFAAAGVASDALCMTTGATRLLSPMHLAACCVPSKMGNELNCAEQTCGGGSPWLAMEFFKTVGLVTGSDYQDELILNYGTGCYPYTYGGDGVNHFQSSITQSATCREQSCQNTAASLNDFQDDIHGQEPKMVHYNLWAYNVKQFIEQRGSSVVMTFAVYTDFLVYKAGVYERTTEDFVGWHAVRVIGWGTEGGVDYWLCANSWGTGWGDSGFFKIKRGSNHCECEEHGFSAITWECEGGDLPNDFGKCPPLNNGGNSNGGACQYNTPEDPLLFTKRQYEERIGNDKFASKHVSNTMVTYTVQNLLPYTIEILWIDWYGFEKNFLSNLPSGQSQSMRGFIGHNWVIKNYETGDIVAAWSETNRPSGSTVMVNQDVLDYYNEICDPSITETTTTTTPAPTTSKIVATSATTEATTASTVATTTTTTAAQTTTGAAWQCGVSSSACNQQICSIDCPLPFGYYPDISNCNGYCLCTGNGSPGQYSHCASGLVYDPINKICNFAAAVADLSHCQ